MPGRLASFATRHRIALCISLAIIILTATGTMYWYWTRPRLNVILVTFDTIRADHLGAYGYQNGLTTEFDEFAKRGVVFERAYAPAPITLPSHATMLTGLYPPEHGLRVNGAGRLSSTIPVLPEILKQHGFDTGAFVAVIVLDSQFGLARGFDTYDDDLSKSKVARLRDEQRREGNEVVDSALSWLRQRTSRPFFCWIHLYDAHGRYDPRPEQFGQKFEANPYDAGVAVEVQAFGRVMSFLKDQKLDNKTLVVVAGDHGEGLGDHSEFEHGMLAYNTTLQVPLVFWSPSECQAGLRVANTVSLVDLMPTVLDLLRITGPRHVSGRSLRAALKGQALAPGEYYAETETPFDFNHWCPLHVVIDGRWKYIQTTRPELYDLVNDPSEETNLAESSGEERQRMQNVLEMMQEKFVPAAAQNLRLSEKDRANLAALGYMTNGRLADDAKAARIEVLTDIKDMLPHLTKFETARHFVVNKNIDAAVALLQEIVQATNEFQMANVLLGECLGRQGRLEEAVSAYRAVLAKQPDYPFIRFDLGRLLSKLGHSDQAASEFRETIKQEPKNAGAHFELGQLLATARDNDGAILEFREAIRIAPHFSAANIQLGRILVELQRPGEAAFCFGQAIKYDPQNALAHLVLSNALVQIGEYETALRHGQKSVELDPQSFDARFNLGLLLCSQNRFREGISQFHEALKLRPDDPNTLQQIQHAEADLQRTGR